MKAAFKHILTFSVLMLYLVSATGIVISYTHCCCHKETAVEFNKTPRQSCPVCEMSTAKEPVREETTSITHHASAHCCGNTTVYIKDFSEYSNPAYNPVVKTTYFSPVVEKVTADAENSQIRLIIDYSLKDPPRPSGKALLRLLCTFKDIPALA